MRKLWFQHIMSANLELGPQQRRLYHSSMDDAMLLRRMHMPAAASHAWHFEAKRRWYDPDLQSVQQGLLNGS